MNKFLPAFLCLVLLLAASGCAKIELNLRVNPDGTGEKETVVALNTDALAFAGMGGQDPLAALHAQMQAKNPNTVITRYQEGDKVGFKAVAPFEAGRIVLDTEVWTGQFAVEERLFWRDYVLDMNTDLSFDEEAREFARLLPGLEVNVSVALPVKVQEHNGALDGSGQKVTWSLVPGTKDHLTLQARQYFVGRIAAVAAGVAALLTGLVLLIWKGRPRSA